jgi:hypothetical protein
MHYPAAKKAGSPGYQNQQTANSKFVGSGTEGCGRARAGPIGDEFSVVQLPDVVKAARFLPVPVLLKRAWVRNFCNIDDILVKYLVTIIDPEKRPNEAQN